MALVYDITQILHNKTWQANDLMSSTADATYGYDWRSPQFLSQPSNRIKLYF